jgi:tetratricopeptide (TPR) repeat protein
VICLLELTLISWMLGYPAQSLKELRAAVGSAQMLGHPLTLAQALCQTAFVHIFLREPSAAADQAEQALRICEEHRIAGVQADALGVDGWARSASGDGEKGLALIAQAVERYGLGSDQHVLLALQADALLAVGKPNEALGSVAAGLKATEKMGGAQLEAELYRLKGEALFAGAGTVSEAETAIAEGINVARRQNAKSWELRCAMSLAKLWDRQGRRREAYDLLAPVYGWFTEGLDTVDLKDAKALLDALTEPVIAAEGSPQ